MSNEAMSDRDAVRSEPIANPSGKRIVLATFGSLGDIHPYIAIGLELKARGHRPILATSGYYREKVEALGLGFHAVRPDAPDMADLPTFMAALISLSKGPEVVIRQNFMPFLRETYDDLTEAVRGADLLVGHSLTFPARLVAEVQGLLWASSVLAPIAFFSPFDPSIPPQASWLGKLRGLGPWFHKPLYRFAKGTTRRWAEPWHQLRAELGLPPTSDNPIFEGQHAPALVLVLFSEVLAAPQPDWPPNVRVTGFPLYDQEPGSHRLPEELERFRNAGPPPIVFTLGSSAVWTARDFYQRAAETARMLGRRAVLLIGPDERNRAGLENSEAIAAFEYAPYSELFPRCSAIVHQGGIGTTAQALRSGRPMLVVPFAFDQPDNADRVARLGVSRVLPLRRFSPRRAAEELRRLLDDPSYATRAGEIGRRIQAEDGARAASDAIESLLGVGGRGPV
ncbi:glycosyltransferase [soil metagenome]